MIDQGTFIVVFVFSLMAFWRGFVKEIFGIVGIFATFYLTYRSSFFLNLIIKEDSNSFAKPLYLLLLFSFFVFLIGFLNSKLIRAFDSIRKSSVDRFCGMILGATKGLIFCFAIFLAIYSCTIVLNPDLGIESDVKSRLPKCVLKARIYPFLIGAFDYFDNIAKFDIKTKNGALYIRSSKLHEEKNKEKTIKNDFNQ